jgi:uncharacterized protein (TIGR02646 family)
MLPIKKKPEPASLKEFKAAKKGKTWPSKKEGPYQEFTGWEFQGENGKAFDQLRVQLLLEQFHLCAYCGQSIPEIKKPSGTDLMKTEHFEPQNGEIENDLNYQNLLCVCLGGQESKAFKNHCDSSKEDKQMFHVQNPAILSQRDARIRYKIKRNDRVVFVFATDRNVNDELNSVLNLNTQRLVSRRYDVWERKVLEVLPEKQWSAAKLTQLRKEYAQPIHGHNIEFKDFILWFLDEEIRKRQA